jgi:hypothetical protein
MTSRFIADAFTEVTLSVAASCQTADLPTLRRPLHARPSGANSVVFLRVPLHELALLPRGERQLRISNVRVNVSQLRGRSADIMTRFPLHISISDTPIFPSNVIDLVPVYTTLQCRLQLPARFPGSENVLIFRQRDSINTVLLDGARKPGVINAVVEFKGKIAAYEQLPGQRTRLRLNFANIPTGVAVFVTTTEVSSEPATLRAQLIEADTNGGGAFQKRTFDAEGTLFGRSYPIARVNLIENRGDAVWEIEDAGSEPSQVISFGISIAFLTQPNVYSPFLGSGTVTASFAPLSTVITFSSSAPIPRFICQPISMPLLTINP